MFIERSTAKIRSVRALFLFLGFVPCAALAAWAVVRHAPAHRDALRQHAEHVLGMPVTIGAVDHLRPGAVRLRECVLATPEDGSLLRLPEVEVETSRDEVRLRVPAVVCGPAAVAALSGVARAWLEEPVRFPKAWVIDVGAVAWDLAESESARSTSLSPAVAEAGFPVRIECVAVGDSRAVRLHRIDREQEGDEIRVIATAGSPRRHELRGQVRTPIPWAVLRQVVPPSLGSARLGPAACVSGEVEAATSGDRWEGVATGLVEGVRLEELSSGLRHQLEASLAIQVERLEWQDDRLVAVTATAGAVRGMISQSLLGQLVTTCGCRAGPGFHSLSREPLRAFDDLQLRVTINGRGLRLTAGENRNGALIRRQGLSLVDEPTGLVSLDRLAWLVAPSDAPTVPASAEASWLMRMLPAAASGPQSGVGTATRNPGWSRKQSDF